MEKKAGIQAFEKFKYINTVNALAGGDITKWGDVLAMPYDRVLTKLLLNKTEAEYHRRYSELLSAQRWLSFTIFIFPVKLIFVVPAYQRIDLILNLK